MCVFEFMCLYQNVIVYTSYVGAYITIGDLEHYSDVLFTRIPYFPWRKSWHNFSPQAWFFSFLSTSCIFPEGLFLVSAQSEWDTGRTEAQPDGNTWGSLLVKQAGNSAVGFAKLYMCHNFQPLGFSFGLASSWAASSNSFPYSEFLPVFLTLYLQWYLYMVAFSGLNSIPLFAFLLQNLLYSASSSDYLPSLPQLW